MTTYLKLDDNTVIDFDSRYEDWIGYLYVNRNIWMEGSASSFDRLNSLDGLNDDVVMYKFPGPDALSCFDMYIGLNNVFKQLDDDGDRSLLRECIESGMSPVEVKFVGEFIEDCHHISVYSSDNDNWLVQELMLKQPLAVVREFMNNKGNLFQLMEYFECDRYSRVWSDLNSLRVLRDMPDEYMPFLLSAANNNITINKIMSFADELDVLYNTWVESDIPIADVFA